MRRRGPTAWLVAGLVIGAACGQAHAGGTLPSPHTTAVATPLASESPPAPQTPPAASAARAVTRCTSVAVTVSPTPPVNAGTAVTATARAAGCPDADYRFQLVQLTPGTGLVMQDWGPSSTWTWDTGGAAAGRYAIQADVRASGETQYDADASARAEVDVVHAAPSGSTPTGRCTAVSVTISSGSTVTAGTQVTATAHASGCSAAEYRFMLVEISSGVGLVMQDWGASNTWTWDTTGQQADRYAVRVDARAYGEATQDGDVTSQVEVDVASP